MLYAYTKGANPYFPIFPYGEIQKIFAKGGHGPMPLKYATGVISRPIQWDFQKRTMLCIIHPKITYLIIRRDSPEVCSLWEQILICTGNQCNINSQYIILYKLFRFGFGFVRSEKYVHLILVLFGYELHAQIREPVQIMQMKELFEHEF